MPRRRPYPVVFLLTSFEIGGTERQMVELIHRLDRSEFEVHVACFHRRGDLEARATDGIASLAVFPIESFRSPAAISQLVTFARWCRRIDARIVHTCELYANIFGLPGAALGGATLRVGNRRELRTPDKSRGQLRLQGLAYKAAHVVVANSDAAARQLREEGVAERKIRMIPNGVDLTRFTPAPRRQALRRIVTVANLRPEKGHDTLIAAAPEILARYPDAQFWIVGDGPLQATLASDVRARGLGARFAFLGQRADVPALLQSCDLFVLPSRSEACPNGVLEAMACGLPVVATRVGGVPELVESGVTGLLIDADAPKQLADAALSLIEQPHRAHEFGDAARAQVERRFSIDWMIASFEQLYLTELTARALTRQPGRELAAS